jgi:hypothetical protein
MFGGGLMKCLSCGKNYKGKMEGNKKLYFCSGYSNYGREFCTYNPIREEDIIYAMMKHFEIAEQEVDQELRSYVDIIQVKGAGYKIYYKDHSESLINWEVNRYGVKVKY